MKTIPELLKEKNLKVTPQRMAIYSILSSSTEDPTAETIYSMLEPQHSTMSLATVYKTVEALKMAGLIQAINVGEDSFRFDATTKSHPHIVCTECKEVRDISLDYAPDYIRQIEEKYGYDIKNSQMFFYGVCPKCLEKKENCV